MPAVLHIVSATRKDEAEFNVSTPLGRTLKLHAFPYVRRHIAYANSEGLPAVYNRAIEAAEDNEEDVILFVHDDIAISDWFFTMQIAASIRSFEICGIAGNTRRSPRQPAWCFADTTWQMDMPHLSGVCAHGSTFPPARLDVYGPPGKAVKLLDGMMLWCKVRTLKRTGLRFDERFSFDFYDLDFCRQAEVVGLSMGTWPVAVMHDSAGNFGGPRWQEAYKLYLEKWGE
ncbi:MAG: glycosyltransferase family 2 protein [Bosea sp. (in: a-proteobacteria)]